MAKLLDWVKSHKVVTVIIIVVLIGLVGAAGRSGSTSPTVSESDTVSVPKDEPTSSPSPAPNPEPTPVQTTAPAPAARTYTLNPGGMFTVGEDIPAGSYIVTKSEAGSDTFIINGPDAWTGGRKNYEYILDNSNPDGVWIDVDNGEYLIGGAYFIFTLTED